MPQEKTEKILVELPYLVFGDDFPIHVKPHDVNPLDEEKRIRVYCSQLQDTVLKNLTKENHLFQISVYYKQGYRLVSKYPHRYDDIEQASLLFWERVQRKLKEK